MDRLDDIEAFLAVVEEGSLTAAARHLRRSLQSITRSLTTLSVAVDLVRHTALRSHRRLRGRLHLLHSDRSILRAVIARSSTSSPAPSRCAPDIANRRCQEAPPLRRMEAADGSRSKLAA